MSTKPKIQSRARSDIIVSEALKRKRIPTQTKKSFQTPTEENCNSLKTKNSHAIRKSLLNEQKDSWRNMTEEEKRTPNSVNRSDQTPNSGNKRRKCGNFSQGNRKKDSDSVKPKRPLNAFGYYVKINFDLFQKRNGGLSSTDIFKCLAESWKNLDPEDKKKYFNSSENNSNNALKVSKTPENKDNALNSRKKVDSSCNFQTKRRQSEQFKTSKSKRSVDSNFDAKSAKADISSSACESRTASSLAKEESPTNISYSNDFINGDEIKLEDGNKRKIKIFTDSFLELSRLRESKLRDLRKRVSELERRNNILSDNLENMHALATACENFDQSNLDACISWFDTKTKKLLELVNKYPSISHNIDSTMSLPEILEKLSVCPKPLPNQLKKSLFDCFSTD